MRMIMVAVMSHDGFITKGVDSVVTEWTSAEDKQFFADIKSRHRLLLMGRKTYVAAPVVAEEGSLRVILTTHPEEFASESVPGLLEFEARTPRQFYEKYRQRFDSCLVLGGSQVYEDFLEDGLIDEIFLTVEPLKFRHGTPLLASKRKLTRVVQLNTISEMQLNPRGTMLYHYEVIR